MCRPPIIGAVLVLGARTRVLCKWGLVLSAALPVVLPYKWRAGETALDNCIEPSKLN